MMESSLDISRPFMTSKSSCPLSSETMQSLAISLNYGDVANDNSPFEEISSYKDVHDGFSDSWSPDAIVTGVGRDMPDLDLLRLFKSTLKVSSGSFAEHPVTLMAVNWMQKSLDWSWNGKPLHNTFFPNLDWSKSPASLNLGSMEESHWRKGAVGLLEKAIWNNVPPSQVWNPSTAPGNCCLMHNFDT